MKSARIGQMKSRITIKRLTEGTDAEGFPTEIWTDVFGAPVWCAWVNAHGSETFDNLRLELGETAVITMRYSPHVDVRCRVFHGTDPKPYEIVSIDNVDDARHFMELSVRRAVEA